MITIKEINEKAKVYARNHFGEEQILFDPMFRKEGEKYYFGFLIIDFVDEKNNDYRIKRPKKWMLVDILTGDFVKIYDSNEYDYVNKLEFSFELIFNNDGSSSLYDYSNYILSSYFDWKKKVVKELKGNDGILENKSEKMISYERILRVDGENITPKEYVLANVEPVLEEAHEILMNKIGDKVQEAYLDYYEYIIDLIRKHYVINGDIDTTLLMNYVDLLKYSWPDSIDIINQFDNISTTRSEVLEDTLKIEIQNKKNEKYYN